MSPLRLLAALLALSFPASAQVLRVPSQHRTIASALAAASSGTTILVAPGLYAERITWPATDGIRLIAEQGFAKTTIDGQKKGTVITFGGGQSRSTLLEGFTISGGFLNSSTGRNHGAGIHISRASPTVAGGTTPGSYALAIPGKRIFAGVTVHQQALVLKLPPRGIGQLSNRSSFTIY